ncbi:MAG: Eco57I restriction-modification methylase domain-containing protein [Acidobacteria bacterium]|nr:Eco57I restriction-modification methylase domain-containing protein [Acidobacteriota bacterium]
MLNHKIHAGDQMSVAGLVQSVDFFRLDANRKLAPERRTDLGQFMTAPATARLMASMFDAEESHITLLDAGAGVGSLTAAFISEICNRQQKPRSIQSTTYEIDPVLSGYLLDTLAQCRTTCEQAGIAFESKLLEKDFIDDGVRQLRQEMFGEVRQFNCAILNPPYKKIESDSESRLMLREIGIETSNLYTGFLSVALRLLAPGGELVAITPRSFCNGPYFKPFRQLLLETLTLKRIHVFESRQVAFKDDSVLQENVIFYGVKGASPANVTISSGAGPEDEQITIREIPYEKLARKGDPDCFIHIVPDELGASVAEHMSSLETTLNDLDLEVSTGRVVDFRATSFLEMEPAENTVPLIYPRHLENGYVKWPKEPGKKPQAMKMLPGAEALLIPSGVYTLVKRFSAKEEQKRIVAAVYDSTRINSGQIGFENHLNYFHHNGGGIPFDIAKGLTAFLNSTLVDMYFRQFNGHTQVNATDLRSFRYPTAHQLRALGNRIGDVFPNQQTIDDYVQQEIFGLAMTKLKPVKAKKKIAEALEILKDLGLPREQQNERSALTLLSLLDIKPDTSWSKAEDPLLGITPMMDYFREYYGRVYAPNTRETVRRQTIHQFLDAGIVSINPDDLERATNSAKTVYRIEPGLLELLKTFGTPAYRKGLETYLASIETLKTRYAREREMKRIPIQVAKGKTITLSPGGQNILIERIIEDFCEIFTVGGKLIYVGDTGQKWAYFDDRLLKKLGVAIEAHGKMPDVAVYVEKKNWLVLIEAVTSHGPVNPKRRGELKKLFKDCSAGLVFVTAFLDRHAMLKYLNDISWETEVWVADAPTHLIHFNGERFLGPYEDKE